MRALLFSACMLLPLSAVSGDRLGDVTSDLGRIADNVRIIDPAISLEVYNASLKIDRIAINQAIQEDVQSKRIIELEQKVGKLQEIISKYKELVVELEAKIPKVAQ